jgi:hypothetical protein
MGLTETAGMAVLAGQGTPIKTPSEDLIGPYDLTAEAWREYDFGGRCYRIITPKAFWYRRGGSTHRVLDQQGVIHCVPAPGTGGCVLRWQNKPEFDPVQF